MRTRIVARQLAAAVMSGVLLGGCSNGLENLSAAAPTIPTGTSISDYYETEFSVGASLSGYPREAMLVGIQYVDDHCAKYFDAIVEIDRRTALAESTILTGANQAQVLMGLAAKSALSIAKVAAAVEITKVFLEQYREKFTFAPHTVELRSLVFQAMKAQREQIEGLNPTTSVEAVMITKQYAQNCTIATIHEQWNRSLSKAVREGVASADSASPPAPSESVFGARSRGGGRPRSVLSLDRFVVQ
jgi:hypothetical protein